MRKWLVGHRWPVWSIAAVVAVPASAAGSLPVIYNGAYGYGHANPTASPPGATTGRASPPPPIPAR